MNETPISGTEIEALIALYKRKYAYKKILRGAKENMSNMSILFINLSIIYLYIVITKLGMARRIFTSIKSFYKYLAA